MEASDATEPIDAAVLATENAELRRRVQWCLDEIERLRAESVVREGEVRRLVADLPRAVSRRAVVTGMVRDGLRWRPGRRDAG